MILSAKLAEKHCKYNAKKTKRKQKNVFFASKQKSNNLFSCISCITMLHYEINFSYKNNI